MKNSINVKKNTEKQGLELYFSQKPSDEIRIVMKANGFRWHSAKACWYVKESASALQVINEVKIMMMTDKKEDVKPAEPKKQVKKSPKAKEVKTEQPVDRVAELEKKLDSLAETMQQMAALMVKMAK